MMTPGQAYIVGRWDGYTRKMRNYGKRQYAGELLQAFLQKREARPSDHFGISAMAGQAVRLNFGTYFAEWEIA